MLAGCSEPAQKPSDLVSAQEIKGRVAERRAARNIEKQIGRFQFHPASGEMPAMVIDTSTGCLEQIVKLTSADNSKDVFWVRQYADGSLPRVVDGKMIPNSAPPRRCSEEKGATQ
jgi:hypothetical protein